MIIRYRTMPSTLTINKVVINDNGGTAMASDFILKANNTPSNFTTFISGTPQIVSAGTYTITETGPAGYAASFSGDCNAQGQVTLGGDSKTCTITNNDMPVTTSGGPSPAA